MAKILVTGAAGLIGREICKQLSITEHTVVGIDNNSRFADFIPVGCEYIQTNLKTFVECETNDFDVVYHMAAINGTTSFYDNPSKVLYNNATTDLQLFKFIEENPNTKLIYASSSEVIAGTDVFPTPEQLDISIKNIHNPRWSYRLPKVLSENYLTNSNIDYLIVRFFNVYSEFSGTGHFVRDIVDKLRSGNTDLIGFDETRSFCYVEDAVDALLNISNTNGIVNLGSDEEITILDAANIISEAINFKNVQWNCIPGKEGSSKRRRPDIAELRKRYKKFSPRSLKSVIPQIGNIL